jgi:hypothetical protein
VPMMQSLASGGSVTELSVTGSCREGAVMQPACVPRFRSRWSIQLTSRNDSQKVKRIRTRRIVPQSPRCSSYIEAAPPPRGPPAWPEAATPPTCRCACSGRLSRNCFGERPATHLAATSFQPREMPDFAGLKVWRGAQVGWDLASACRAIFIQRAAIRSHSSS